MGKISLENIEMFNEVQNPDIQRAFQRVQEYASNTRKMLFVFVSALLVVCTILLVMVYNLNMKVESITAEVAISENAPMATPIAPTATAIAPTATAIAPTATAIAPTTTAIAPTQTAEPTATQEKDCRVGYQAVRRFPCGDEEIEIKVGFESIEAPFQVAQVDNETARFNISTRLQGSALADSNVYDSTALVSFFVHTDNKSSQTGLPEAIEFGPENGTWALSVQSDKNIITGYDFTNEVFTVLQYGSIVELLYETNDLEKISAFFTVSDSQIVWLQPLENNGYTSTGTVLYSGLYGCNEGGTCLGVDDAEIDPGVVFTNEEGDYGRLTEVSVTQVQISIDGETYSLQLPLQTIIR